MSTPILNAIVDVQSAIRRYEKAKSCELTKTILEQREQIQNDILCVLDGLDNEILDAVCSIIVERFAIILEKL